MTEFVRKHGLTLAIAVAILVRVVVAIYTSYSPIFNENSVPASPLHAAPSSDLHFYVNFRKLFHHEGIEHFVERYALFYLEREKQGPILAAPIFPSLLLLFDYRPRNTLPLAIFYLVLSMLMAAMWLRWFHARDMPFAWLILFTMLPHPIWFTLNVGSDLLGALFFAGFFISYFGDETNPRRHGWAILFAVLLLFTRPNGVSIVLFFIIDKYFLNRKSVIENWIIHIIIFIVVASPLVVFYFPYLYDYIASTLKLTYFGYSKVEYLTGIFDFLPYWLNLLLSWLSLIGAKVLYLLGLRPSFGDTNWIIVLLRSLPGLMFLPGLLYFLVRGERSQILLIVLFLLPILLGGPQDRYTVPIQPVLYFFGTVAYISIWRSIRKRMQF